MSESIDEERGLRERLAGNAEDRLGRAFSDLLDSPLLSGALGRAFDAREKAAQAQELAMGALNLPSAADIERLTRRLRSVSQRLEGIEDAIMRLDRTTSVRLTAIEEQLKAVAAKTEDRKPASRTATAAAKRKPATSSAARKPATSSAARRRTKS
jgi:hypothetical protein